MDHDIRTIANLIGQVASAIRLRFGVIPGMTPHSVMELSHAVESLILDHMSRLHDVRDITDEDGHLRIPPPPLGPPS
jgi:hypothetical protein